MFNNYKVNLQYHGGLAKFLSGLNNPNLQELQSILQEIEQLINKNMEEKEKLLNVVNNMQIQTQNNLDNEIMKNSEMAKQIASQKMIIQKQLEEIAQLNQFVMQKRKERRSLYSSPLQTSNKQTNFQTVTTQDCYQKLFDEECKREELMLKIWKKMQAQSLAKTQELQSILQNYLADQQRFESIIENQQIIISKFEEQLSKYKVGFSLMIQLSIRRSVDDVITIMKSISCENQQSDFDHEQLIETLIDFSNKRDQLYQLQQQEVEYQNLQQKASTYTEFQNLQEQLTNLQELYQQTNDQKNELLNLSQQMDSKNNLQLQQINSMNEQISQLTQLFAKALQDLENVQEENEMLRKNKENQIKTCKNSSQNQSFQLKHSSNFTTRSSEVQSRFSVGFDEKLAKCFNSVCSNYNSQSTRNYKSIKNKSMLSQLSKSQYGCDVEELCNIIDSVMNNGFSKKVIEQIMQLGNNGFKKKLKDLLFTIYNNNTEIDGMFESFSCIAKELEIQVDEFEISSEGLTNITPKLEKNTKHCLEMFQVVVERSNKNKINDNIVQQIGQLSKVLLQLCQGNDDTIVSHIDKHIEISKQLKERKNKQIRDLQFSTCKMIMDIFKKWKQNYIQISTILYSMQRAIQQDLEVDISVHLIEMTKSDLGKVIQKELNKLFQLLI